MRIYVYKKILKIGKINDNHLDYIDEFYALVELNTNDGKNKFFHTDLKHISNGIPNVREIYNWIYNSNVTTAKIKEQFPIVTLIKERKFDELKEYYSAGKNKV